MMTQNDLAVVGIDVAKDKVDLCIRALALRQTCPNTAQGACCQSKRGNTTMHVNTMRAGLERGEPQIGTWLTMVRNPAILSLMKSAGLDFARVDMEHTALTIERIADLAVLARALNFPIAVRPPKANREWITRLLDNGVWNLHCPQVENAEHAREIVDASRYAPMGLRGNGGLSAATDFDHHNGRTEKVGRGQKFDGDMLGRTESLTEWNSMDQLEGLDRVLTRV